MSLVFPLLCPHCFEKVFFFQDSAGDYGVADSIEQDIDYHICPFLAGAAYWQSPTLKRYFSLYQKNEQDLIKIFSCLNPALYFKKTTKVSKKAILIKHTKQEPYDLLYFSSFDFCAFSLVTKQKEIWRVGTILDISLAKITKNKQYFAADLKQAPVYEDISSKKISLKKINQKIFAIEFYSKNITLLEKGEHMILKTFSEGKLGYKKNKILAIYPKQEEGKFTRKIVFFLHDSLELFFSRFALPDEVNFSLLQENFSLKQNQLFKQNTQL
jgi:hypothetical protein